MASLSDQTDSCLDRIEAFAKKYSERGVEPKPEEVVKVGLDVLRAVLYEIAALREAIEERLP